jgi:peptidoglycan/xylan/chitin deacetylase (PgdA/CDA1 family)
LLRLLTFLLLLPLLGGCSAVAAQQPPDAQKRIALTFDDVPRGAGAFFTPEARTRRLIAELRKAHVKQAAFFVTVGNLDEPHGAGGEGRIGRYAEAGHVIANHSFSHRALTQVSAEDYLTDIDRAEAWLKGRKGHRPWFRYPFLNQGRTDKAKRDAVRAGLKRRDLGHGFVTVDASDWNMEARTAAAVKAGKALNLAALRDLYVESHVQSAEFNHALALRTIGRSPAHVMLLHETDLAALHIGDLVQALRRAGWQIVSADEAFADPLINAAPDVPSAQGPIIELLAWEKGLPAPRWYERNNIDPANRLFAERVLGEKPDKGAAK